MPRIKADDFVKSHLTCFGVIPAKAGIQSFYSVLDSRLRGNDDNLAYCEFIKADAKDKK